PIRVPKQEFCLFGQVVSWNRAAVMIDLAAINWRSSAMALLLLILAAGCDDQKAKIADIQKKADERIAAAEQSAREKVAALQKQLDTASADFADAAAQVKAEATDAISKAQSSADDAAKAAATALDRTRKAYKEKGHVELSNLKQNVTEINAKIA